MMTALLLYAYRSGIYASRRIAKACRERVDSGQAPSTAAEGPDTDRDDAAKRQYRCCNAQLSLLCSPLGPTLNPGGVA
jgi:hypothetical protein